MILQGMQTSRTSGRVTRPLTCQRTRPDGPSTSLLQIVSHPPQHNGGWDPKNDRSHPKLCPADHVRSTVRSRRYLIGPFHRSGTCVTPYVKNSAGERVIDFRKSNLHLLGYSIPVRAHMTLERA